MAASHLRPPSNIGAVPLQLPPPFSVRSVTLFKTPFRLQLQFSVTFVTFVTFCSKFRAVSVAVSLPHPILLHQSPRRWYMEMPGHHAWTGRAE